MEHPTDILFIDPSFDSKVLYPKPPLWYLFLRSSLNESGISCAYLDLRPFEKQVADQKLEDVLVELKPRVVGISSMTGTMLVGAVRAAEIASHHGAKVVWGGIHPTLFPEQVLRTATADYVVTGEGEKAFAQLTECILAGKSPVGIKGVGYIRDDVFCHKESDEFLNLAEQPIPDWDALSTEELLNYTGGTGKEISMYTSRGCPAACAFCYNQAVNRRRWRAESADKVLMQVDLIKKRIPDLERIVFCDDNFAVDVKRMKEIARGLSERGLKWACDMRCDCVTEDLISELCTNGLDGLYLGIETASDRMLEKINKGVKSSRIYEAVEIVSKYVSSYTATFMFGLPGETIDDVYKSMRLIRRIISIADSPYIQMRFYAPYPGCALYDECIKEGFEPPKSIEEWGRVHWLDHVTTNLHDEDYFRKVENILCIAKLAFSSEFSFGVGSASNILRGILQKIARLRMRCGFYSLPLEVMFLKKYYKLDFS